MIDIRENEHIIFEIRKHWFIITSEIIGLVLLAFIPLMLPQVIDFLSIEIDFTIDGKGFWPVYLFFYSLWLLILWIIGFVAWTNYFLDVWIVTNEKIIDVEQIGLFSREVSVLHLKRIQDITTEVHGVIQTFLVFGDLHVQTAGQQREFVIEGITDPNGVAEKINDVLMKYGYRNNKIIK